MNRPFKVLGIQQIAIGGPDKLRLQKLWVELFGLEFTGTFKSERENVDEDICALGTGPLRVEVDLMQPLDPAPRAQMSSSTFSRSLAKWPVTSRPKRSTQSFLSRCLSGPPRPGGRRRVYSRPC